MIIFIIIIIIIIPKNIYNFTIRYINNSLPTRKNLNKWGISSSSECTFCLNTETLLHVVAGCQSYLDRFTWRHNSILNFLAQTLQSASGFDLFSDLPGFKNPSIVTGDTFRPDLLLASPNHCCTLSSSLLAMSPIFIKTLYGRRTNIKN